MTMISECVGRARMLRTENNRVNGYEGRRSVKNVYAPTVLEEARLTDRHLAVLWLSDCNRKKEKISTQNSNVIK